MRKEITIITEGDFDANVLRKILSAKKSNTKYEIQSGNGFSSALSKARTILSYGNKKVIVVLDSDTIDEIEIKQKKEFIDSYINPGVPKDLYKIVLAIPEFEIIFLNNERFLEAIDLKSKQIIKIGKISPKRTLESFSGLKRDSFLSYLEKKGIREAFFTEHLIKEICNFIEL